MHRQSKNKAHRVSNWAAAAFATFCGCLGPSAQAQHAPPRPFAFAAVGDTAYSIENEQAFDRMVDAMNRAPLAFVAHVGDFEADPRPYAHSPDTISMPCTDERYAQVLASFQRSVHPFVLTPGDNDWADCHFLQARQFDPLERLDTLRTKFFPPGRSLGQRTMPLTSQATTPGFASFRENLRWRTHGVVFATLHTVGSNDNRGHSPALDAEQAARMAANLAWLKQAFAAAKAPGVLGLVLFTQANIGFEAHWTHNLKTRYVRSAGGSVPQQVGGSAYDPLVKALADEMLSFDRPVLFVHGDTHLYRVNRPLLNPQTGRFFDHFTRLEVFGDPDSHWVRVTVDPAKPGLFTIDAETVPGNRAH